jgi:hypothetical protein
MTCGIAVHPRTGDLPQNPFDFPLFRNRTPELIKNAKIIIAHYSTSLSYAVLEYKPIVFLAIKSIEKLIYGQYEKAFAKELGLKLNYIDKDYTIALPTILKKDKYDLYIKNYLIDKSIEIHHSDMPSAFLAYLENLEN